MGGVTRVVVRPVVEVRRNLAKRGTALKQSADGRQNRLLPVVLAVAGVAQHVGAAGLAARRCLGMATVMQPLNGQSPVQLSEHTQTTCRIAVRIGSRGVVLLRQRHPQPKVTSQTCPAGRTRPRDGVFKQSDRAHPAEVFAD